MEIIITPGGWGNVELQDICQVLNSVDMAFQPCFGENISRFPVTVIHVQNSDSPYCNRTDRFVYLTTEGTHWCQYAYQFSHEYCHLQIPRKVQSRLRWFEESICELASFYFMPRVSELWEKSPPYLSWLTYAPHFKEYAVNMSRKKPQLFDLDFSNLQNPVIEYLEKTEYDRPKNAFIATKLMPIFEADATLWRSVPMLCEIPDGLSLCFSLKYWQEIAPPEYRYSIQEIAHLFSLKI